MDCSNTVRRFAGASLNNPGHETFGGLVVKENHKWAFVFSIAANMTPRGHQYAHYVDLLMVTRLEKSACPRPCDDLVN